MSSVAVTRWSTSPRVGVVRASTWRCMNPNVRSYTHCRVAPHVEHPHLTRARTRVERVDQERQDELLRASVLGGELVGQPSGVRDERPRARRGARVDGLLGNALHPLAHTATRITRARHPVREVVGLPTATVVEDHEHQLVLRREVPVERGAGEARLHQDVAHLGVDRAGALDHAVRGVDDALDVLGCGRVALGEGTGDRPVHQRRRSLDHRLLSCHLRRPGRALRCSWQNTVSDSWNTVLAP